MVNKQTKYGKRLLKKSRAKYKKMKINRNIIKYYMCTHTAPVAAGLHLRNAQSFLFAKGLHLTKCQVCRVVLPVQMLTHFGIAQLIRFNCRFGQ